MKSIKITIAALSLFSILMISCGKDDTNNNGTSQVMLINAAPDAPALDAYADGAKINSTSVSYPSSSDYISVAAGNKAITIKEAGTGTAFLTTDVLYFLKNFSYSLFIVDSASIHSAFYVYDDLTTPAAGKSNFRILHLSSNTPSVDFILRSGADSAAITNLTFKSIPVLFGISGKTYDIKVKLTGTQTVIATATGVTLNNGKTYTLFLKGLSGTIGTTALGIEQITNK